MNIQERIEALETEFNEKIKVLKTEAQREDEFPQVKDDYWYVDADAEVMLSVWYGDDYDKGRLSINNVFKTKEQADFTAEKLRVEAELRKFGRPFMWGTENTAMLFDGDNIKFDTRLSHVFQGAIYFESENKTKEAIESVGEERIKKYIFGVED